MASGSGEAPTRCANCGTVATLDYCPGCGQRQQRPDLRLRGLLRQLFAELVEVDGRFRRTARSLLTRPGEFAIDYFEDRRARHLPPLRVYLLSTVLLFVVLPIFGRLVDLGAGPADSAAKAALPDWHIDTSHPEFDLVLNARLNAQMAHFLAEPQRLAQAMLEIAPQLGLLLLPLLAALLYAFFWKAGYRYGHHLIVALTLQSGVSLWIVCAASVLGISGLLALVGMPAAAAAVAWPVAFTPWLVLGYLALALHRIYGRRWGSTALRMCGLGSIYAIFVLLAFAVALVIAFFNI